MRRVGGGGEVPPRGTRLINTSAEIRDDLDEIGGYMRPIGAEDHRLNPNYCPKCHSRTVEEVRRLSSIDPYHGVPELEWRQRCPNRRRWFDGHSKGWWSGMLFMAPRPRHLAPGDPGPIQVGPSSDRRGW